jgi:hypothetical protein
VASSHVEFGGAWIWNARRRWEVDGVQRRPRHTFVRSARDRQRQSTPRDSHHTQPHSCSTHRCRSRRRRCTLRRVVNFPLRRPFFDCIALYLHHPCSNVNVDNIIVRCSTHSCNSIVAGAPLVSLQQFPVFYPFFLSLTVLRSIHPASIRARATWLGRA